MTEKDLKSIKIINLEIKRIESVLSRLKNTKGNEDLKELYADLLHQREDDLLQKKIDLEKYIASIEDAELRLILTWRFIDLKNWNFISKQLHYDRSTVYLKFKKFIESNSGQVSQKSTN